MMKERYHGNQSLAPSSIITRLIGLISSILFATLAMIRRIFSTFIDQAVVSEFFQPSQPTCRVNVLKERLDNFNFLFESAPCFSVSGSNVRIISEPKDFYETLLHHAGAATKRISLSSLYLGIGKLENDLLKAIQTNLNSNKELNVNILLDFTRGTRGKQNSKAMIMPLIKQSSNCNLSLYHTPVLRGITKRLAPGRWNELLGLQHMKIYLFDNTVLISGANLSNDYFTNRQDRYVEIKDHHLANFFSNLLAKVQEFSLKVDTNGDAKLHESWKMLPYEGDKKAFATEARKRLQEFFVKTYEEQNVNLKQATDVDTWIFPTLEMGQLNVHHDSLIVRRILRNAKKGSTLNMATGYFNLTDNLMEAIVNECEADVNIIMAHPSCNGFLGSSFPAGGIPDAYSLLATQFYNKIKRHVQEQRIKLMEYKRDSWTYHAKGLWYTPEGSNLPCMTVIGSSNYGARSVNRDLESQLCLVTENETLQKALKLEHDHLCKYAATAESELVKRSIPNWVKAVVLLFKNFF